MPGPLAYVPARPQTKVFILVTIGARFISTKVHRISSVVNPKTKKVIPANEAVEEGIIDEQTGTNIDISFYMLFIIYLPPLQLNPTGSHYDMFGHFELCSLKILFLVHIKWILSYLC